jgi:pimeloyl-ACP methyl ester carboxylesterase
MSTVSRRRDASPGEAHFREYLRRVYDASALVRFDERVRPDAYDSGGRRMAMDWYDGADGAPTIVFVPGSLAYGRLFAYPALLLHELGFGCVTFDFSRDFRGKDVFDFTIPMHVANIADVVRRIRAERAGPVVLFGLSYGGIMSLLASEREPVDAMIWYASPKPASREFVRSQRGARLLIPILTALSKLLPRLRVPLTAVVDYDKASSERSFLDVYGSDPGVAKACTLRALASTFRDVDDHGALARARFPFLVMHARTDRLFSIDLSRAAFDEIGSADKRFVELESHGHWPSTPEEIRTVVEHVGAFAGNITRRAE